MNENLGMKRKQRKIRITKEDYKKKTRKLWKWIIIGGNFSLSAE